MNGVTAGNRTAMKVPLPLYSIVPQGGKKNPPDDEAVADAHLSDLLGEPVNDRDRS